MHFRVESNKAEDEGKDTLIAKFSTGLEKYLVHGLTN